MDRLIRVIGFCVLLAAASVIAGCADQIEFRGRAFELVGLANNKKTSPEDVPTRAPLVVPPNQSLPAPGARGPEEQEQVWPDDPDEQKKTAEAEAKRKRQEYYDNGDWSGRGGIDEFEKLMDPSKRRPGLFGDGPVSDDYRDADSPE